jgi:ectoine hydroxylase-related dioxygenase (phytanoyl-CoA dioxygenase family)
MKDVFVASSSSFLYYRFFFPYLSYLLGDIVVLHGRIIHKSGENKSDQSRHAYTIHITEADSVWDAKNWLQRESAFPTLYI